MMNLKEITLFEDLDEHELKIVSRHLKEIRFKAGETIIHESESGNTMYIFREGKVKITRKITLKIGERWGEAEKAMDVLDAKQVGFFGEMSLVTGAPRSATITAITDCTLYQLSSDDLESIAREAPLTAYKIMMKIAQVLANRVRRLNDTVLKLTTALSLVVSKK